MSDDANEVLMSGGVRSATLKTPGDWVEGFIYQPPELRQQRDPATKLPKTWRDGNPAMEIRVILMTEPQPGGDEDDDGLRAVYVRGDLQRAVREAVRAAGAAGLEVGGKLRVRHTAVGPAKQAGFNGPKLYEAKYKAPEPSHVPVPDDGPPIPEPDDF